MDLIAIRVVKVLAVVGLSLSLFALVLMVVIRVEEVSRVPLPAGFSPQTNALRHILDGMKEAGVTFLLSGLLYVACVIAQSIAHHRRADDDLD